MAINPLNSGSNYVSQVQPQPQSQAERAAVEKANEQAREEAKKTAATGVPVQPSANAEPKKVGSVIDVKA
jgi:hypothetical protein